MGVVTARQVITDYTLRKKKKTAQFHSFIYLHTSHNALQARVQQTQYTITTFPLFLK